LRYHKLLAMKNVRSCGGTRTTRRTAPRPRPAKGNLLLFGQVSVRPRREDEGRALAAAVVVHCGRRSHRRTVHSRPWRGQFRPFNLCGKRGKEGLERRREIWAQKGTFCACVEEWREMGRRHRRHILLRDNGHRSPSMRLFPLIVICGEISRAKGGEGGKGKLIYGLYGMRARARKRSDDLLT